jgi:hypothetical protein
LVSCRSTCPSSSGTHGKRRPNGDLIRFDATIVYLSVPAAALRRWSFGCAQPATRPAFSRHRGRLSLLCLPDPLDACMEQCMAHAMKENEMAAASDGSLGVRLPDGPCRYSGTPDVLGAAMTLAPLLVGRRRPRAQARLMAVHPFPASRVQPSRAVHGWPKGITPCAEFRVSFRGAEPTHLGAGTPARSPVGRRNERAAGWFQSRC